ncbi:hypothetical protein M6B38_297305 [Iris pallida]|uniref:Uncharacterized protein n=1 Tax=Iris pallida TaxID=29817 RepID=A0AAX6HQF7_IRIPA|nr:hypothetical protein M6B38_297305 [Iris pallida]
MLGFSNFQFSFENFSSLLFSKMRSVVHFLKFLKPLSLYTLKINTLHILWARMWRSDLGAMDLSKESGSIDPTSWKILDTTFDSKASCVD